MFDKLYKECKELNLKHDRSEESYKRFSQMFLKIEQSYTKGLITMYEYNNLNEMLGGN